MAIADEGSFTARTKRPVALAELALGVTIIPSNVVPAGLRAAIRSLKPPVARQLVAFTRQDWSPLAAAFLEVLQAQAWHRRPASATVVE